MIWLDLLRRFWKPLAVLVLCAGISLWAYLAGKASERTAWQTKLMDERLKVVQLELKNGQLSDELTRQAASAQDVRQAAIDETWAKAQRLYANRPPVPAVCPSPDAGLLRDMEGATGRIGEARDQLRSLRAADHADAGDSYDR